MKHKLQNLLKHNWRTLLLLLTLITTSQGLWGGNNVIHGDFGEGWKDYDMGSGNSVTINVTTSGEHEFGLKPGGSGWQANSGTMERTNHTNWTFDNGDVNCKINADVAGSYTFTYNYVDGKHKITVSYPWVIRGNFSGSWKSYNISNGTTATITDAVANSSREFKVFTDNVYSCQTGTCGTMSRSNCTNWALYTGNENSSINMDVSGTYTFTWSNDNNHKLSVTYPAYTYKLRGSWDNWSDATDFTYVSSTSWTCTKSFSKTGVYNFNIKSASGSEYKGNGKYITRAHTSETLVPTSGDGNYVSITIDHTGSYTFNFNPSTGGLTVTYPTPSAPTGLYIKGPLVNNGVWTDNYKQNWSSMTYNKTSNVYTFSFNASNACNNCSNQPRHFCVSTGEDDNGKIHWAMNSTRTNWDFVNNEGSNFVASSSLVTGTSVPVVLTITYDASTNKYNMELTTACTSPTQQDVYIGSSGTTSDSFSVCSSGSTSIWLNASEEGYSYQLKKQNGASWGDVGDAWSNESSGTGGHEFSGITAAANYKIIGYPTSEDGSRSSCAIDMLNQVTLSHYDDMALSDVSIDASSVCKSGTTTIRTSGANIGGTGVVNYSSSNTSIVSVSDKTTASATLTGGSTAGEATITVSISGGCGTAPASKTATLTVNPDTDLSGATISFTPSATCNGNGSVASISDAQLGGGTGAWSWESGTGKGSINATTGLISGVTTATTGSHTFRYTVTGGCGSNGKTKDENVTLGYSPIVSPITKTVKAYEPVSLTCTNANVTWAVNGGETPTHYIYDSSKRSTKFKAAPGTYMVTATNATMTCPGASTIVVEADDDCVAP